MEVSYGDDESKQLVIDQTLIGVVECACEDQLVVLLDAMDEVLELWGVADERVIEEFGVQGNRGVV